MLTATQFIWFLLSDLLMFLTGVYIAVNHKTKHTK